MAITHLGLHGPQKNYGTFAPKAPGGGSPTPAPKLTSLGLCGSMRAYASFIAKSSNEGGGGGGSTAFWVFGDAVVT